MKKNIWKVLCFTALALMVFTGSALSQKGPKTETANIKTSAQCEMCKERIEKALSYEKGVKSSVLDLDTKIVTVVYKPGKTSLEKIRKALNLVGYDADQSPADPKAYQKLPPCCKKPDDPDHQAH